jgi:hypothetical protein
MKKNVLLITSINKRKIVVLIAILVLLFIFGGGWQWVMRQHALHTVDETDTYLFYVLQNNEKPYIVRCEKGVKERLMDYHLYSKRVRIISNLLSNPEDLPSEKERKELEPIETNIVNAVIANNEKEFTLGGYVTGRGKKELFLYANDLRVLNKVFKDLQHKLPTHNLKLDVQEDKNWDYYNSFCEKRQLPSAY